MTRAWVSCTVALGLVGATAFDLGAQNVQNDPAEHVTVALSEPARVGTLIVQLQRGSVSVTGGNRDDVAVEARSAPDRNSGRRGGDPPAGLRRLTPAVRFTVEESENVVRLSSLQQGGGGDFVVQVPARMNLKVSIVNGGMLSVEGVDGDIEANNLNGAIVLKNVAGSVVAHSNNGDVVAALSRVTESKAMAFTSLNGDIDVTLPASVRANLNMRTGNGDVYTDFEMQPARGAPVVNEARRAGARYRIEVNRSIRGTLNGGGPEFELRTLNGDVFLRRGQ
jgi:hypothetical protein